MAIAFNHTQPRAGFNKYGHYQFGYKTCQYCKSDNTQPLYPNQLDEDELEYTRRFVGRVIYSCSTCKARAIISRKTH